MTTTTQPTRPRWVLAALTALLVVWALLLAAETASAATTPAAENRIRASSIAAQTLDRPPQDVSADQRLGNTLPPAETAVATGVAAKSVPDPKPVYKPNGAPDRSSPWYVSYRDADGNLQTVGNLNGVHTEVRIQERMPGTQMSRPFGWRTLDPAKGPEWVEGTVCQSCQIFPPSLFPPGTRGAPGGPWGHG